jgi:hypothetical protein
MPFTLNPGVVHSFDTGFGLSLGREGHLEGEHPEARVDSFAMTKAFLDARLKSK